MDPVDEDTSPINTPRMVKILKVMLNQLPRLTIIYL